MGATFPLQSTSQPIVSTKQLGLPLRYPYHSLAPKTLSLMATSLYDNPPENGPNKTVSEPVPKKRMQFVNGVSLSTIKKIAVYDFGAPSVHSIKTEENGRDAYLILNKEPEEWAKQRFEKFWQVKIKVIK